MFEEEHGIRDIKDSAERTGDPDKATSCELLISDTLTLNGEPVPHDVGMAIIVDGLLGKGFFPDGFTQVSGGRNYRYRRQQGTSNQRIEAIGDPESPQPRA